MYACSKKCSKRVAKVQIQQNKNQNIENFCYCYTLATLSATPQTVGRVGLSRFCSNVAPNRIIMTNYIKKFPYMISATKAKFTRGN